MKPLLSFVLIVFVLKLGAQIKHVFGPENVPVKDIRLNEVLGGDIMCFYTHKISTDSKTIDHFIEKIDRKSLQSVWLKELSFKDDNYNIKLHRLIFNEDELIAFVSKKNKKAKSIVFSVMTFAANSLTKLKETILTSIDLRNEVDPKVIVKTNPDNTMALVKISMPSINYKETITELAVYDIFESSKLWNKRISDDLKHNGNNDMIIDEEGNVHYIYFSVVGGVPRKETSYNLQYNFITRHLNTKRITLPFEMSAETQDLKITILQNKTLCIAGTYREIDFTKKPEQLNAGIFNYVLDFYKSQIISKKFIAENELNKNFEMVKTAPGVRKNYNIDDAIVNGNSCILIGHRSKSSDSVKVSPINFVSETNGLPEIDYFDIFLIKLNQSGEVEYCKNLPFCSKLRANCYMDMCDMKQIVKQYFNTANSDNLYLFHNEDPQTTKVLNSGNQPVTVVPLSENSKHFVCNKINLKDGSIARSIIEIPKDNAFTPVLESDHSLAHPFESKIFDKHRNNIYVPIKLTDQKERFLTITLE